MSEERENFLKSMKVPVVSNANITNNSFSDRDVYTCLRLMGDTAKVQHFLLTVQKLEVDEKVSTEMSDNYFYNICDELGHAEYEFRKQRINVNEFNNKINEACKKHNLDFGYLMEITGKIDSLEREPDTEETIKLAQEIEETIREEHEKRIGQEKD